MNEFSTGWQFSLPTINFDEVLKDKAVLAEVNKNLTLSQQFWGASSDTRVEDGRLQGLINGKWYDISSFESASNTARNQIAGISPTTTGKGSQLPIDISKVWPILVGALLLVLLLMRK